ncbi:hypothetical protein AB0M50_40925 [Nonomuraea fuscirosea]|uniref:hypothetical protein n=1 Tax=Nonomuraea fuscirosea TaxID=1291556 RepID=UPI002DD91814|nr:hypothetical protein [Nonomuraea fuscirosea]WSA47993.1 hypothetical protein OIE67_28325 [Nonomuraea fuscirosea]
MLDLKPLPVSGRDPLVGADHQQDDSGLLSRHETADVPDPGPDLLRPISALDFDDEVVPLSLRIGDRDDGVGPGLRHQPVVHVHRLLAGVAVACAVRFEGADQQLHAQVRAAAEHFYRYFVGKARGHALSSSRSVSRSLQFVTVAPGEYAGEYRGGRVWT